MTASQLAAARGSSQKLMRQLRNELAGYRMVLLAPRLQAPPQPAPAAPPRATRRARGTRPQPKPLSVPDNRLLDRLDPQIAGFVREYPAVESVLTREIVRDLDDRILDPRRLMERSSLRISFDLTDDGRISQPRIEKSSGVPSIDHLALELSRVLGDYQLPPVMNAMRHIVVSIEIAEEIVIRIQGAVRKPEEIEQVRTQVQSTLAFLRFALGAEDGAFILQEISVTADEQNITLTRRLPKGPILGYLAKYYGQEPR